MWWLIGRASDFRERGPGFASGISHNDPDALQDHCETVENLRVDKVKKRIHRHYAERHYAERHKAECDIMPKVTYPELRHSA